MINVKQEYEKRKSEIQSKLDEFAKNKDMSKEDLFLELCFCLSTPLSKAERAAQVINKHNKELLIYGSEKEVANLLKGFVRFHNNKACYIVNARNFINVLGNLPGDPVEARNFLVDNIKGLGMKEASHFLRNIGYRNLCIVDGHIMNCLCELKVLPNNERPSSKKEYLEVEGKMKDYSRKVGIDADELDLVFWSSRTGKIIK
jgi:N-glycosylase/DNA lyase